MLKMQFSSVETSQKMCDYVRDFFINKNRSFCQISVKFHFWLQSEE